MDTEPALTVTAITTAVAAVIAALVAFGVPISPDQKEAVLALVGAAYVILTPILVRAKVVSPETDAVRSMKAYADGAEGAPISVPVLPAVD